MSQMTPREIVEELDKHIVGQKAAKRAVAIALRNRWRRQQVAESLRAEITPKTARVAKTASVSAPKNLRGTFATRTALLSLDVLMAPSSSTEREWSTAIFVMQR